MSIWFFDKSNVWQNETDRIELSENQMGNNLMLVEFQIVIQKWELLVLEIELASIFWKVAYNEPFPLFFWRDGQKSTYSFLGSNFIQSSSSSAAHWIFAPDSGLLDKVWSSELNNSSNFSSSKRKLTFRIKLFPNRWFAGLQTFPRLLEFVFTEKYTNYDNNMKRKIEKNVKRSRKLLEKRKNSTRKKED